MKFENVLCTEEHKVIVFGCAQSVKEKTLLYILSVGNERED